MDDKKTDDITLGLDGDTTVEMTLSGSIGDGPVVGATVVVRGVSGEIVATQSGDQFARYQLSFSVPGSEFPLLASVEDGTDLVTGAMPDFPLIAGILTPGDLQVANLNPMGTLAVRIAQRMDGGLSPDNLNAAVRIVDAALNFGIDTGRFVHPITSAVTVDNVANVVRASEALGEVIRRTQAALLSIGQSVDFAQLLDSFSADLVDGAMDGRGADGADLRIAATANMVSAQVAIEVMTNQLQVSGTDVTQRMDMAILQVMGGDTSVSLTGAERVSAPMIEQARVYIDAAMQIDDNPDLALLGQTLELVQPGQTAGEVIGLLPEGGSAALNATILTVSVASTAELEVVNEVVRDGLGTDNGTANLPPTIAGEPTAEVLVGTVFEFIPTAADPDGQTLGFSVTGRPNWANFDAQSGRLWGMPSAADVGTYTGITITVTDGIDAVSLPGFSVAVSSLSNRPPTMSGMPASTVTVGNAYEFTPTTVDADGDTLRFSVIGLPRWAQFDAATGRLSGTPGVSDIGLYPDIQLSVSDGTGSMGLAPFAITVSGLPNRAPTISGSPSTRIMVGNRYTFIPSVNDPDGDVLSFSVAGLPVWADFNLATGELSGQPAERHVSNYSGIQISVTDGRDSATLIFSVNVVGLPNRPPTITGSPSTQVTVGEAYEFAPAAADVDGDKLNFVVAGLPAWASFDSLSGRLWGTPGNADEGTYSGIRISVSDGRDSDSLPSYAITVNGVPNRPPTIAGAPAAQVTVGTFYEFTPSADDPDGDALQFSIIGRPSWMNFDAATGRLSGTPTKNNTGTFTNVRISVSDGSVSTALSPFAIAVIGLPNQPPTITGAPAMQVTVGNMYAFTPSATDPDGDALSFTILGKPGWASFDAANGRLFGTPAAADAGSYAGIQITVSDSSESAALTTFGITVNSIPNQPPTISGTPAAQVTVNAAYEFTPAANDPDGDQLNFTISAQPGWLSFDAASGRLFGTPGPTDENVYPGIRISVTDGNDSMALPAFSITVNGLPNKLPTIGGVPAAEVTVNAGYDFLPQAGDPDGDALTFSIAGKPVWANFDLANGHLWGAPGVGDEGSYSNIRISVSDGKDSATLSPFSILVNSLPNQPPTISGTPAAQVTVGNVYDFTPAAGDPDGDALSFALVSKPAWANFDPATGRLWGAPVAADEGIYSGIGISVSDGSETVSLPAFGITVSGLPNQPPTINGAPATQVTVGNEYSFIPVAGDPDGDTLTFTIIGMPAWANFDAGTGRLWGIPTVGDEGVFSGIRISVSDGSDSVSLPVFAVTVLGLPNRPPILSGTPPTEATIGSIYDFMPQASDPDGDALTFSIIGKPAWASFDSASGQLSGAPLAADIGTYAGIQISVSDGAGSDSLIAFTITVIGLPNQAPTISGIPSSQVAVGNAYSFMPSASDADGDLLSFSIMGKPGWASFDISSGLLSGTPGNGDLGSFPGIEIRVSDGVDSVALPAFSITVNTPASAVPTISGEPPTQVAVDGEYTFKPAASDPNGVALTFSIVNKPVWAVFDVSTGKLSGIPGSADSGTTMAIMISVSNGSASASLPLFSVTVGADSISSVGSAGVSNTQPSQYVWGRLAVGEKVYMDRTFTFVEIPAEFVGMDYLQTANNDKSVVSANAISFDVSQAATVYVGYDVQIATLPAWLQSWTNSGFQWFNTDKTMNVYQKDFPIGSVTLGGNEQGGGGSMYGVAVMAQNPNASPLSITGTAIGSITVGLAYGFAPTATGGSGVSRTFSIINKPSWAVFDTATGALTGMPGAGAVGTTSGVIIGVSDGSVSVELPAFDISVVASALGSATLSWSSPTVNTDGTALTDLAGFNVYYGTTLGRYENTVAINNPGLAGAVIGNLTAGTWFFTVTAFDATGNESAVSNIDSKTVTD